jgi:aspartyl/asparaginyl beta-hydroxylase (cupin superfamily)
MAIPSTTAVIDNKHFFDISLFPDLHVLAENRQLILSELHHALRSKVVQKEKENGAQLSGVWCESKVFDDFYDRTKNEEGWLHWWSVNNPDKPNDNWTIFGLMHNGKYMTENCKLCPETTRILSNIEGIRVAGFSRLQPRSGIDTHKGFTGRSYGALAFHLGLLVPPTGASLHCGPHQHHWKQAGEVIIFDDTFPHSAWNDSDEERIILYIDFKIPNEVERVLPKDEEENVENETENVKAGDGDLEAALSLLQAFRLAMLSKKQQKQMEETEKGKEKDDEENDDKNT